jgi:hypothetical protein
MKMRRRRLRRRRSRRRRRRSLPHFVNTKIMLLVYLLFLWENSQ